MLYENDFPTEEMFFPEYFKGIGEIYVASIYPGEQKGDGLFSDALDIVKPKMGDLASWVFNMGKDELSNTIVPFIKEQGMDLLNEAKEKLPSYVAGKSGEIITDLLQGKSPVEIAKENKDAISSDVKKQIKNTGTKVKNKTKQKSVERVNDMNAALSNLISGKGSQKGNGIKLL